MNGTALIIRRFDDRWISATRGDVSYELDRQDGNLTYASSTTKDGVTTIVIGSGRCKLALPRREMPDLPFGAQFASMTTEAQCPTPVLMAACAGPLTEQERSCCEYRWRPSLMWWTAPAPSNEVP